LPLEPRPLLQLHPDTRILIASQAPGAKAHASGTPFDDASGVRLRQWMGIGSEIFYDPSRIGILPLGFCYPGKGKTGDLPPMPQCRRRWQAPFLSHLANLKLILLVGRHAQSFHLGAQAKKSLTETVACWQDYDPLFMPLPHPSPLNQRWIKQHPWFMRDIIPQLQRRVAALIV
jgi:uracil-DNA glycosylase